jgi:hypothetical protein
LTWVPAEVVMKPKVFVGSSTKALPVAELIQSELKHDAEAVLWSQGLFRTINVPIEDLMTAVDSFDFAVFVLDPEDRIEIRGEEAHAVRDNVIFELGLFLGKLGRGRNFFIAPSLPGAVKCQLPSDLSGITPAQYNPAAEHLQASVGASLLQLKQAIRNLAARVSSKTVLYESGQTIRPYDFVAREGAFWKNGARDSEKGTGKVEYLKQEGVLKLTRTNQQGRFEVELRHNGSREPSIRQTQRPPRRVLRVACEAKVDKGEHTVRFVLKDANGDWVTNEKRAVGNTDWQPLELYFDVSPISDLLLRIDDEIPTEFPSALYMRHLVIEDAV